MKTNNKTWPTVKPKNIIVRMPNWIGDLVMATPILEDLRRHYPEARLTAMCQSNVAALLTEESSIDEILSFKRPNGWMHSEHRDIITPLRYGEFDLGILTTNSFSSAWWFWRGHVKHKLGYAGNLRSWLLDKALPHPPKIETQHLVTTYKMLLEPLGIPISNTSPHLTLSKNEIVTAITSLAKHDVNIGENIVVGINPGAAYGSAKCWLPDRFKLLTEKLLENPSVRILYFGDDNTAPLVAEICKDMSKRVVNLAGKTSLRELMAHISLCSAMLSNDSGPMHIAAALKTPLVAIFGSTSDVKTGPYQHGTVIHKHVECSPCYKKVCPIDFRCMTRIEVEEVCQELLKVIEEKPKVASKLEIYP